MPTTGTHFFMSANVSFLKSPLKDGPQKATWTNWVSAAKTLPALTSIPTPRYLINGVIVAAALPEKTIYTYKDTGIQYDNYSSDGSIKVMSGLLSNLSSVPLTGFVYQAPKDFSHYYNVLYDNPLLLNTTATWANGSAYLKRTATHLNDVYQVLDASTATYDNSPSNWPSTTLDTLMNSGGIAISADGVTYTNSNGDISIINGVKTYVAQRPRPRVTTEQYRTFYEINGNVYTGSFIKSGTPIGGNYYKNADGTYNYGMDFGIRLNKIANDSLASALTF